VEKGIDPGRLKAEGHGESIPVAPNNTPEGRAENRRVEFKIAE
jgi:outer membrane protein OmpA-like peptidoglycan-associated protein